MQRPIRCTLLDVGGTLWSSRGAAAEAVSAVRIAQLQAVLPGLTHAAGRELHDLLRALMTEQAQQSRIDGSLRQDTHAVIRQAAQQLGLHVKDHDIPAIRKAMYVTPIGHLQLFPGAHALLGTIRNLGLGCVAVSNVSWRDKDDYQADFTDMGIADYFDAIVTSVDVGFRKPHRAMFEAAVAAARCPAHQCVMIGNSEAKDIQPARALGMRAIRVDIERADAPTSQAQAVVTSLDHAIRVLRTWATQGE